MKNNSDEEFWKTKKNPCIFLDSFELALLKDIALTFVFGVLGAVQLGFHNLFVFAECACPPSPPPGIIFLFAEYTLFRFFLKAADDFVSFPNGHLWAS